MLRPTQPCRKIEDIDKCLDLFIQNRNTYDSLRIVVEFEKSPYKMYSINPHDNLLILLFGNVNEIKEPFNQCRQVLPKTYLHNSCIDIIKTSLLYRGTISGDNIYPYVMNKNETSAPYSLAILAYFSLSVDTIIFICDLYLLNLDCSIDQANNGLFLKSFKFLSGNALEPERAGIIERIL